VQHALLGLTVPLLQVRGARKYLEAAGGLADTYAAHQKLSDGRKRGFLRETSSVHVRARRQQGDAEEQQLPHA